MPTFTNDTRHTGTLTSNARSSNATFSNDNRSLAYLLKEDGFYLLQENGGKIIISNNNLTLDIRH